ncbi:MAG: DUF2937 family protein [Rhodospirillaceae bacterium]|nr:DUF2937 family protein [Rhodospirillaceae bacterium]
MIRLLLALLIGGLPASQAVPFTEDYLHNLAGRVAELRVIVGGYAERAEARGLSLADHIAYFATSDDPAVAAEGLAMHDTVERYGRLRRTAEGIEAAPPILHPVLVAEYLDNDVAESVLERFSPGLSASVAQLFYFFGGLVAVWLVLTVLKGLALGGRRLAAKRA